MAKEKFITKLHNKVKHLGKTEVDSFSDGSGSWISIYKNGLTLEISFDPKGENITSFDFFKDVVEVVGAETIASIGE